MNSEPSEGPKPEPPVPVATPLPEGATDDFEYVVDETPPSPRRRRYRQPVKQAWWVRIFLLVLALGFTTVIVIAAFLRPYTEDGTARTMSTHTQLGLEPCSMVVLTGKPCPACGMTTSFALLMHGDVGNSLKANWVGTLFCASIIVLTPWLVWSSIRGRLVGVRNPEMFSTILLSALLLLMTGRWIWIITH
jgi:magnesium-transporting ATPase (P-type)